MLHTDVWTKNQLKKLLSIYLWLYNSIIGTPKTIIRWYLSWVLLSQLKNIFYHRRWKTQYLSWEGAHIQIKARSHTVFIIKWSNHAWGSRNKRHSTCEHIAFLNICPPYLLYTTSWFTNEKMVNILLGKTWRAASEQTIYYLIWNNRRVTVRRLFVYGVYDMLSPWTFNYHLALTLTLTWIVNSNHNLTR